MTVIQTNPHFPKCSGAFWLKEEGFNRIPKMEGSPFIYEKPTEKTAYLSGYCSDMVEQLKKFQGEQLPGTQLQASGIVVISNPAGMPVMEHRFGDFAMTESKPANSWAEWASTSVSAAFNRCLSFFQAPPLKSISSYPQLIGYLSCASSAPTETGLRKSAKEFSMPTSDLAKL